MATIDGAAQHVVDACSLTYERDQLRALEAELRGDARRLSKLAKWYELGGNTWSGAGLRKAYRYSLVLARRAREAKVMAEQVHREAVETTIVRHLHTMGMTERYFSEADLKERYRALVFELHPDRQPVKRRLNAHRQMVRVNSAFQHLLAMLRPSATRKGFVSMSVRVPSSRRIA